MKPCLTAVMLAATFAHAQSNRNPLVAAAGRGDLPAVNALLTAGADPNDDRDTVPGRTTALKEAARNGHLAVVQALLAAKADSNSTGGPRDDDTALALAAGNGRFDVVQALLDARADVNAGAVPPLHHAVAAGDLDMVRVLLAAKPKLDWQDELGRTTLMTALAPLGRDPLRRTGWDIARLLVEAGANVNVPAKWGATALKLAVQDGSPRGLAMVQALLAAGADVNGGCVCGRDIGMPGLTYGDAETHTALGLAARRGTEQVVQALLEANAQRAADPLVAVNARQIRGNTPLTIASAEGRPGVVRLLLAAKADLGAANDDGKTALMLALENGHEEVAELLRQAAAALPGQR